VLKPQLVANGLMTVYETLERPLVPVLARMERSGISIDRQVLSRLSGEFAQRAAALEDEIKTLAGGVPLNPQSKQIGESCSADGTWRPEREEDQDRCVVDLGLDPRGSR